MEFETNSSLEFSIRSFLSFKDQILYESLPKQGMSFQLVNRDYSERFLRLFLRLETDYTVIRKDRNKNTIQLQSKFFYDI